jgi:hypothetical protein
VQNTLTTTVCKTCGTSVDKNYCAQCGQPTVIKRITFKGLMHDVLHLFTHVDKGILFTLKKLILAPGTMQRDYVDGDRARHQKPFSMFFICATVAALARYWMNIALMNYFQSGDMAEGAFFNKYLVILHIVLVPVYALITYVVFYSKRFNYSEIGVLLLYTMSFFFLLTTALWFTRFIWQDFDTAYIELPCIALYNAITFRNFFKEEKTWVVIIKSVITVSLIFIAAGLSEDLAIDFLRH